MRDDMTEQDRYCLGLLASEMGEALQVIGNVLRFGLYTPERPGELATHALWDELGDVAAAIQFAVLHRLAPAEAIEERRDRKLAKLLDPEQRDNLGRRLAPEPPAAE